MAKITMTRCYSLTMGSTNGIVAWLLFLLSRLHAEAGWPTLLVAVLGPAATLTFLMIAIAWFLDALRPGVMRRFVPGGVEPQSSLAPIICGASEAPLPLPPTIRERLCEHASRLVALPARAFHHGPRQQG